MMDWIPVILVIFKALVLGTGMFFAIKWHYDKGKKEHPADKRAVVQAAGKAAMVFVLALVAVGLFTFVLVKAVGLNLNFP